MAERQTLPVLPLRGTVIFPGPDRADRRRAGRARSAPSRRR